MYEILRCHATSSHQCYFYVCSYLWSDSKCWRTQSLLSTKQSSEEWLRQSFLPDGPYDGGYCCHGSPNLRSYSPSLWWTGHQVRWQCVFLPLCPSGWSGIVVTVRAGGCQSCRTHISVTAWRIFFIRNSVELPRPVVVHCHGHLPHTGLPMGQKLVKFVTNWVHTLLNTYLTLLDGFTILSFMDLSRPVVAQRQSYLPICPIWACPLAKNYQSMIWFPPLTYNVSLIYFSHLWVEWLWSPIWYFWCRPRFELF